MSSPATNQIVKAYQCGLGAEAIAADLGYDIVLVKSVIEGHVSSRLLPETISDPLNPTLPGPQRKPTFSEDEREIARRSVMELVEGAEVESVRLKASQYVLDDSAGRLDVVKQIADQNFSVQQHNAAIQRARLSMELTREKARREAEAKKQLKTVDV